MIRKIVLFISLLFCATAHAAEMVNVEYIHKLIARDWGIDIPYNPALTNPKVAANMKYLLATVDRANEILNGVPTEYGGGEYATMYAADTVATNDAVARLIKKGKDYTFEVITTPDTDSFSFEMSAAGTFTVDWGDGEVQEIVRTDTESATYSHTYARARKYKIGFEGQATGYITDGITTTIRFTSSRQVGDIRGSLGAIFSTISNTNGGQPRFGQTFKDCQEISKIPENLFAGVSGAAPYMFAATFHNCSKITEIPENLFAGISGASSSLFTMVFADCTGLTSIPENLFAGVSGAAGAMFCCSFCGDTNLTSIPPKLFAGVSGGLYGLFDSVFAGCTKLTSIPENLFAGVNRPMGKLFNNAFSGCTGLTEIPENLFGNISGGVAELMFSNMFSGCTSLTGQSVKINGKYLYEIWPDATAEQVGSCYNGATGLTDYANIPDAWK